MITGTMAMLVLVLSLLGIVGFAGLLILGVKMWGEERAAKRAAQSQDLELKAPVPAEIASEIEAAPVAETPEPPAPPAPGPAMESLPSEPALPASEIPKAISAPEPSQAAPRRPSPHRLQRYPPPPKPKAKAPACACPS